MDPEYEHEQKIDSAVCDWESTNWQSKFRGQKAHECIAALNKRLAIHRITKFGQISRLLWLNSPPPRRLERVLIISSFTL